MVNFLKKYNLDRIDLVWEYPNAPDIPNIPVDDKNDGKRYLELLKLIKFKLPSRKTLSITIPASYWYLKNFPIKDMQKHIDYQVYMAYDMRRTWDSNSDNVIRYHTDKTEVVEALRMLDMTGFEIGKTYGGIANYGRSYKFALSSCSTTGCSFSGPRLKPPITKSVGILTQPEIDAWATKNKRWTDEKAQCDFMIYDKNNLIGWPKAGQRNSMEDFFHHSGLAVLFYGPQITLSTIIIHQKLD